LLAAATAAPGDVAVIRVVTEGLIEAGKIKMAARVLQKARFLCHGSLKDRELQTLSERVRFETVRSAQRETTRHEQDADYAMDGGRLVLPFVGKAKVSAKETATAAKESIRLDVVSLPQPHFPRLRIRRADR
jgi:hypothetical protein